jgi:hypothetical protein
MMVTQKKKAMPAGMKPTVFVIEDHPTIREVMVRQFQHDGFNAEGFTGAEPGIVGTIIRRADAVLLDKNLLEGEDALAGTHRPRSGLTIAHGIRDRSDWVRIALYTAEGGEPPQEMAPHDAFIPKDPRATPPMVTSVFRNLLADRFPALKKLPKPGSKTN